MALKIGGEITQNVVQLRPSEQLAKTWRNFILSIDIKSELYFGLNSTILQNEVLRLRIIPDLGCKIVEIFDKENQHEWLWSDKSRPIKLAEYGDAYDKYDISGFDECFPNIGISKYPEKDEIELPDHGEIWSLPWKVENTELGITATVIGKIFEYRFSRRISLIGRKILINYSASNIGKIDITYLWSAHPLFKIDDDMKIEISGNPKMLKEFGFGGRIGDDGEAWHGGHLSEHTWPIVLSRNGNLSDISEVSLSKILTDKVVLDAPTDGIVKLRKLNSNRILSMKFEPNKIPYLGICFNFAAWPLTGEPATWVALEPTTGRTDRLDECKSLDSAKILKANESKDWQLELEIN
ncbi:MAG: hypothetical protein Q8K48_08815 [Candidatus Planktophila sp.]|nr:hypothetical protein [Candidatus Planktophila sp.]